MLEPKEYCSHDDDDDDDAKIYFISFLNLQVRVSTYTHILIMYFGFIIPIIIRIICFQNVCFLHVYLYGGICVFRIRRCAKSQNIYAIIGMVCVYICDDRG